MDARSDQSLKVALVRAPPPNWPLPLGNKNWTGITINISESVDAGIALINKAKSRGAALIAFPELWFPGFPKWREMNNWKETHLRSYIDNCLVINSPEWNRLIAAIKKVEIWTALAFAEKQGDNIFMAQALISSSGQVVLHRHKLRPSGSERDMFSDGTIDMIKAVDTPMGRATMLQCGEHWLPSMNFTAATQRPKLHIGCFPFIRDFKDTSDSIYYNANMVVRGTSLFAMLSGAYVLMPAVGYTFILDPFMHTVAEIKESVSFEECPILYHNLPLGELLSSEKHVFDEQVSWDVLQQILAGFPEKASKIQGTLVPRRSVSVNLLESGQWKWSEDAPGTPAGAGEGVVL